MNDAELQSAIAAYHAMGGRRSGWKLKRHPGISRVYFAHKDGLIKIGTSQRPDTRCVELDAELIRQTDGDKTVEAQWHDRFAHLNVYGEWFRPDPELCAAIAATPNPTQPDPEPVLRQLLDGLEDGAA